jgi:predicted O-methyltransferase YrrM
MRPSENAQWLAVEGWCTPEEGDALYDAACDLPRDATVVEIGTWKGRSAVALALGSRSNERRVITIDDDTSLDRLEGLKQTALTFEFPIVSIVGDSRDWASRWDVSINFLYIDGWHDSENVRADYAAWATHVVPNGAIWFHDAYGAGWPDVHALIDELVASEALVLDGYVGTIAKCRKRGV